MTTPITQTTTQTTPTATKPAAAISSDFETFLKMLTVQMRNQDPLNPVEGADYAVQLATFSGVEQQVQTNDLLKSLTSSLSTDGLASLAGWIGKEVPAATPTHFDGSPQTLVIERPDKATDLMIEVRDSGGRIVERINVPEHSKTVQWLGATPAGAPMPTGTYSFQTIALADGSPLSQKATPVYQRVTEVGTGPNGGQLTLASGESVAVTRVTALREAR